MQVLIIAQTMKLFKLRNISLDGTKIKANASKHKALAHGRIETLEAQLREEVQFLLNKAAQTDVQESENDLDLPAEIARREERLETLAAAKAKIADHVQARDCQTQKDFEEKSPAGKHSKKRDKNLADVNPKHLKPVPKPKTR